MKNRIIKRLRKQRRAIRFSKHLLRFVNRDNYSDFLLTKSNIEALSEFQTNGRKNLSEIDLISLIPFVGGLHPSLGINVYGAQQWKEITLDCLQDEMKEWARSGWGWIYPWLAVWDGEKGKSDWIMKKALLEIKMNFELRKEN